MERLRYFRLLPTRVDARSPDMHDSPMLRYLRSTFGSSFVSGMFACLLTMLVAVPVLKARAAIGRCHEARVESLNVLPGTEIHDDGHEYRVAAPTHDDPSEHTSVVPTRSKPMERTSKLPAECCLPGCGIGILEASVSFHGAVLRATPDLLLLTAHVDELDPSAPRKPPRTTYIVDRTA
jgi:hypothetical protein